MTRVAFEGVTLDARTRDMFERLRWKLGIPLVLTQGSYNAGGVGASAGTHDGGGALDIRARDLSAADIYRTVLTGRQIGFAMWERPAIPNLWPHHIHGVAIGCPDLAPIAANQVSAYKAGYNGLGHLGRGGPDDGPRGYQYATWELYQAAHPDEEWIMSVGDDILRALQEEAQRNKARETVYANREAVQKDRYEATGDAIASLKTSIDANTKALQALAAKVGAPKA